MSTQDNKTSSPKMQAEISQVLAVFGRASSKYPWLLTCLVLFTLLIPLSQIIAPIYYKKFFDLLAGGMLPNENLANELIFLLLIIFSIHFLSWIFRRIAQGVDFYFGFKVSHDLYQLAFEKTIAQSHAFFSNNFSGSLLKKISRFSNSFLNFGDLIIYSFIPLIVTLFGIILVLLQKNLLLGLIFLIWTIIFVFIQYKLSSLKHAYRLEVQEEDSKTSGLTADILTNENAVKIFTGEGWEKNLLKNALQRLYNVREKLHKADELLNSAQGFLFIFIEFIIMYVAVHLWQKGILTIGDFALLQAYLISAISQLWGIGNAFRRTSTALSEASEGVYIINLPPEVKDSPGTKPLVIRGGEINFSQIGFAFGKQKVFENLSLLIPARQKLAIVGHSGSGKSTLVKLFLRLHDVSSGEILIDGQDIKTATLKSVREAISFVSQDPALFHRSLKENIRYGKREATDEEVYLAAKHAHADEFIQKFADGYDTLVGERGVKLSGGERQRIAIARAILKNSPILILDEATASLDSESEKYIQDALKHLMAQKTVLVIAHRLSTIMQMDRIVVLEDGQIIEDGTHAGLLKNDGLYKKLWSIQAGGFIE